ncbi:hypothetical protein LZ32DRAFT_320397 [Colletotrichum eremochloae]|nr:hypothetical protein LZ32DRAFT_320397 [Colletotrichum eremochloae]
MVHFIVRRFKSSVKNTIWRREFRSTINLHTPDRMGVGGSLARHFRTFPNRVAVTLQVARQCQQAQTIKDGLSVVVEFRNTGKKGQPKLEFPRQLSPLRRISERKKHQCLVALPPVDGNLSLYAAEGIRFRIRLRGIPKAFECRRTKAKLPDDSDDSSIQVLVGTCAQAVLPDTFVAVHPIAGNSKTVNTASDLDHRSSTEPSIRRCRGGEALSQRRCCDDTLQLNKRNYGGRQTRKKYTSRAKTPFHPTHGIIDSNLQAEVVSITRDAASGESGWEHWGFCGPGGTLHPIAQALWKPVRHRALE